MKRKLLFIIKIAVSICLIVFLLEKISLQNVLLRYSNIYFSFLILAFVILILQASLSTLKWQFILKSDNIVMPYAYLLKTYLIGNFISLFLPSSFGGDIYRVYAIKGMNKNLEKSTSSVLFDRASGLFALVSIACFSYIFLPKSDYNYEVLAFYFLSIFMFISLTSEKVLSKLHSKKSKVINIIWKLLNSFLKYRRNTKLLIKVLAISFLFQFNIVVINKIYCWALGIDFPFKYLLVIIPLIYLTETLPISINGLGVRESAFVFFFIMMGRNAEEGLAASLLVVFMRYLFGIIGGILLLLNVLRSKRLKEKNSYDAYVQ